MRPHHLALILLLAALSFAGSFECHAHSGDDDTQTHHSVKHG